MKCSLPIFCLFLIGSASSLAFTSTNTRQQVDMNKYNLEFPNVLEEWSAEVHTASSMMDEGIYLGARDKTNNFADSVTHIVSRKTPGGLGLELEEIAGGREDGIGITVITGLVEGGNSDLSTGTECSILPGDCITALEAITTVGGSTGTQIKEETTAVSVECFGYDKTVEAIMSLPPDWEQLRVTTKRLRRKPKVNVRLQYPPEREEPDTVLELFAGENLRRAMLTRGVKLNDALSRRFDSGGTGDCGAEGTCATCVIGVAKGGHLLSPQSIQEEQILANKPKWRFACKAVVGAGNQEGDIVLQVNPRRWDVDL